jgi:hypothetical protein
MSQIELQVLEGLRILPQHKQEEVLDFIEFLKLKTASLDVAPEKAQPAQVSFIDAAKKYIGCVEGPGDLSSNRDYMQGYGL